MTAWCPGNEEYGEMTERSFCCEVDEAHPTLVGSAVHVDVWLLVEYAYAWKPKALEDNILPRRVLDIFDQLTRAFKTLGLNLRIQFIKQAASELHSPRLYFADGRDGHVRLLTTKISGYSEFPSLSADELLAGCAAGFLPTDEEIYLVCTNGQRDICCARFGRPLYSRLHETYGKRIWQTTHLGGHRYAPNLLCLPSGYVYGYVSPEVSVDLVRDHDNQQLDIERLRGRSHYLPHVQAGEIFTRREHNLRHKNDLVCAPNSETEDGVSVQFSNGNTEQIVIHKRVVAHQPSDCETRPKPAVEYFL